MPPKSWQSCFSETSIKYFFKTEPPLPSPLGVPAPHYFTPLCFTSFVLPCCMSTSTAVPPPALLPETEENLKEKQKCSFGSTMNRYVHSYTYASLSSEAPTCRVLKSCHYKTGIKTLTFGMGKENRVSLFHATAKCKLQQSMRSIKA